MVQVRTCGRSIRGRKWLATRRSKRRRSLQPITSTSWRRSPSSSSYCETQLTGRHIGGFGEGNSGPWPPRLVGRGQFGGTKYSSLSQFPDCVLFSLSGCHLVEWSARKSYKTTASVLQAPRLMGRGAYCPSQRTPPPTAGLGLNSSTLCLSGHPEKSCFHVKTASFMFGVRVYSSFIAVLLRGTYQRNAVPGAKLYKI